MEILVGLAVLLVVGFGYYYTLGLIFAIMGKKDPLRWAFASVKVTGMVLLILGFLWIVGSLIFDSL